MLIKVNWLKHYATSRKVAVSIPNEVVGAFVFNLPKSSNRIMGLGLT
jgi:hypothetical protein